MPPIIMHPFGKLKRGYSSTQATKEEKGTNRVPFTQIQLMFTVIGSVYLKYADI